MALLRHLDPLVPDADSGRRASIPLLTSDHIEVVSVCDNVTDVLLTDTGPARRFRASVAAGSPVSPAALLTDGVAVDPPLAQHGYSSLVRVVGESRTWSILFDTGATPEGCVENLRRLGIDPTEIDAIVLSHGHYDHVTGLSGLAPVLGPRSVPIVVHPHAFAHRRFPVGDKHRVLPTMDRAAIEAAGFVIEAHDGPTLLADDRMLVTGEVERHTGFEPGLPTQEALVDGDWQPDALMPDDQAMVMNLDGHGLVVMTGCGHSGIVNITDHAKAITDHGQVHAVMGGFHLGGKAFEGAIDPTVAGLVDLDPDVVVPTHCTGWKAIASIADALPDAFIHNSVGTTYNLER